MPSTPSLTTLIICAPVASVAVVVKDKRDHTLEVHRPAASPGGEVPAAVSVKLEGVSRPPQSILSGDFDRDGSTDLVRTGLAPGD